LQTLILIFTDLDGTLLDHNSYTWDEAEPAIGFCKKHGVPVIMVSSKTRAEMNLIRLNLGLTFPFISENGGGIFFPKESENVPPEALLAGDLWKWSLGRPYEFLTKAFGEIKEELGLPMRGFSEMTAEEISWLTGLSLEASRLASIREFDEPFMLPANYRESLGLLFEAAKTRGLSISEGGRFYHLHGREDKAEGVEKLIQWYRTIHPRLISVGLGDGPNDLNMLKRVDYPVLVRSSRSYPGIEGEIPGVTITSEEGPRGWKSSVLRILNTLTSNKKVDII
jgi:mannosyl-3-phosphoglycerate phosphatase